MYAHLNSVPLHGKVFCKTVRIAQDFPMFPKEQENYNHSRGWEIDTLIHHKLYKNMQQQIGGNTLSGFCFFAGSFLNTLPIPRQDQAKLTESYNQNAW